MQRTHANHSKNQTTRKQIVVLIVLNNISMKQNLNDFIWRNQSLNQPFSYVLRPVYCIRLTEMPYVFSHTIQHIIAYSVSL